MLVSTKGRYALSVMLDLAQNEEDKYISLKDIANRQGISMKYLEIIVSVLNKGGLLDSQRGKQGGYRLARPAREYSVGEILNLTEGSLAPVNCLEDHDNKCEKAEECMTLPLWKKIDDTVTELLSNITLEDVLNNSIK